MTANHFQLSTLPFTAGIIQCALSPRSDRGADLRLTPEGLPNEETALDWNLIEGRVYFQAARLCAGNARWQTDRLPLLTELAAPVAPLAENVTP